MTLPLGMGGWGAGRCAAQQRAYALRCLLENKRVLLAWVICDRTAKRPVTIVDRGTKEKSTDLRKPLCSPRQLMYFLLKISVLDDKLK